MISEGISPSALGRRDGELIPDLLAVLTGELMVGAVDAGVVAKFAQRFVDAGQFELSVDGTLPSAGHVARAMDHLIDRVRVSLSESDGGRGVSPKTTAHVLDFPSKAAATACREHVRGDALDTLLDLAGGTRGWRLYVVHPELSPDAGFQRRAQMLTSLAAGYGGTYSGSQGALPDR